MKRMKWVAGIAFLLALAFGIRFIVQGGAQPSPVFRAGLAEEFFDRYVDGDGRVVRRDQGSDTVSEGQAYAMLLAVALEDADAFGRVWDWTRRELQRSDGLLSWHWVNGSRADEQSASDADVDAALALLIAGERFGNPAYIGEARRIAEAIIEVETIDAGSQRVLVAGPWAREERVMNPSYLSPETFRRFSEAFGDDRWSALSTSSVRLVSRLSANGLPPDWAVLSRDGGVKRLDQPSNGAPSFGLDAARVPIRFAASCESAERDVATRLRPDLSELAGTDRHPVEIVAAASAAHAAGVEKRRDTLLVRAERVVRARPSYYGWAWVALGRAMLDSRAIFDCGGGLGFASGATGAPAA